jgi:GT2 family glycosyltransferase
MVEVSIVIPNYNGEKLLEKNLPAVIKASESFAAEIIVVDDGSTDGSVTLIREKFPQVKLVTKSQNEGFTSAVNLGVKKASGQVVVLLNTDVRPDKDFLEFLLPHLKDKSVFAVGCLDRSIEGDKVVERGRGAGKFSQGFLIHSWADPNKGTDTLWVSGGSGAFERKKWLELGGMRNVYNPFYYEDIDLSWQAQKRGWRVLFEPRAVVSHEHGKGTIKNFFKPEKIKQTAYRNQFLFVWLNISKKSWLLEHFLWLPTHIIKAVLRGDWPFILGFLEAVGKLKEVFRERVEIRKVKVATSDQDILQASGKSGTFPPGS